MISMAYTGPSRPDGTPPPRRCVHHPARADGLGIDLAHHLREIRSIVLGSYSRQARRAGIDPDDLIVAVCETVLRSNLGKNPYDPAKSSVMRYLHLVTLSRLCNMRVSMQSRSWELLGIEQDAAFEAEYEASTSSTWGSADAVARAVLPRLVEEARLLDQEEAEDSVLGLLGVDLGQGWREQAVRWVVEELPKLHDAARWWGVPASVARDRFEWARGAWKQALGAVS